SEIPFSLFFSPFSGVSMNRRYLFCLGIASVVAIVVGACSKKAEAPPITELDTYEDKIMNFSIKFPKNWKGAVEAGKRAEYYSSENIMQRFREYNESDITGAKIAIMAYKLDGQPNLDSIIDATKIFQDASVYSTPEKVQLDGVEATRIRYAYTYPDGEFKGERYFAMKDSTAVTVIEFESFGGTFDALHPKFEEILQSVKLAYYKPVVRDTTAAPEVFKPSESLTTYDGKYFSMQYPTNFSGKSMGGGLETIQFQGIGGPVDCIMNVTVTDASKQNNLDRIVEQNKKLYKATSSSPAKLGGETAAFIEDSPVKDIRRRTYFAVKDNKLYRVTLQWYKPEQEFFLPTFEKCLASISLK
ncbi:MAG: PsbP-related protein, partial [Bacteroidota bacterium]|nr:hypothetical protein [Candidatus Kapabacteria bacterium]MDW8219789.1 PsbP-related protein [Bacteroidota bacterium]